MSVPVLIPVLVATVSAAFAVDGSRQFVTEQRFVATHRLPEKINCFCQASQDEQRTGLQPSAPLIESRDFSKAIQERALTATLRLKNPDTNGEGTAVRIKKVGPWIYYLTAAHVVGNSKSVDLECYDTKNYPKAISKLSGVDVWKTIPEKDLAILRGTPIDDQPLTYLNVVPLDKISAKPGFSVLTLGCNEGLAPSLQADRVREIRRVHKPDGTIGWYWETEKTPVAGRSGGPMVDKAGFLIGICSGTSDKVGFYVEAREIRNSLGKVTKTLLEIDP